MKDIELHLFRVRIIKPKQLYLFDDDSSSSLFLKILMSKPKGELRKGSVWLIGNVVNKESIGSFKIGRVRKSKISLYNGEKSEFINLDINDNPNTMVIFDANIGLLAIQANADLNDDPESIANNIKKLFYRSDIILNKNYRIDISVISDPEDFIQKINRAFCVTELKINFSGPNPIDADELFNKPLSKIVREVGGENGIISLKGNELDKEVVTEIAKNTAATGNRGTAKVRMESRTSKIESISIYKGPKKIFLTQDEFNFGEIDRIMVKVHKKYNEVKK